jgi:hypothetical protein
MIDHSNAQALLLGINLLNNKPLPFCLRVASLEPEDAQ